MRLPIRYRENLNAAQLEAVLSTEGPHLVIAGAGSGKTRTLIYRVAHLVEKGSSPREILLLTFTRKAAQEMLQRATDLLDNRCEKVTGGTFHSFANFLLRKYADRCGISTAFAILDRPDAESLISMLRKDLRLGEKNRSFPKKNTLANIFSKAVNKVLAIDDVLYQDYPHLLHFLEGIVALYEHYQNRKREHNFLDYDDLLIFLQQLLRESPDIRDRLSASYRYIMVDEYQDTNKIQADILHLLTARNSNIMVVGDDAQSIYAFRGANFRNIIEFPQRYSGTRIIYLEENYRSVQPILDLTNEIIGQAAEKYTKTLFTRRQGGLMPLLLAAEDENDQSRYIIEKIQELQKEGLPLNQIAVLFRAGFHSFDLEIELSREGIPFIKVGGFKFVESAHIKDILAHLRVIANPYDRISWYRILLLIDKVGPKSAQRIYEALLKQKAGYRGLLLTSSAAGGRAGIERLQKLFAALDSQRMSPSEMGEAIVEYYLPILRTHYDDHPRRQKDLEQLIGILTRYRNLKDFLADMALEPPNISAENTLFTEHSNQERLVLSTVHSAKGLEWQAVFVIWVLDGRFPSIHALQKQEELEEELRLIYVAATRAKERLFFTYPAQIYDRSTGMILNRPSRFLEFISDDILEKQVIDFYY